MDRARQLAGALLLFGVWATAAPYVGPTLGFVVQTRSVNEVVTHIVPGVPVLAVAVFVWATRRFPLPAALVAVLGGFWMTGTHLPLLLQAAGGGIDWPSAIWHSTPGLTIFVVSAAIATYAFLEERDRDRNATSR